MINGRFYGEATAIFSRKDAVMEIKAFVKAAPVPEYWTIRPETSPDSLFSAEPDCCIPDQDLSVDYVAELQIVPIKAAERAGEDQWGTYYNMTGNEGSGTCFLCGAKQKRRYCKGHRSSYRKNYSWSDASHACLMKRKTGRDQYQHGRKWLWHTTFACDGCEHKGKQEDFQVHHIIPLCGHKRTYHRLNHQDNLTLLCRGCHNERHRRLRVPFKLLLPGLNRVPTKRAQLMLKLEVG